MIKLFFVSYWVNVTESVQEVAAELYAQETSFVNVTEQEDDAKKLVIVGYYTEAKRLLELQRIADKGILPLRLWEDTWEPTKACESLVLRGDDFAWQEKYA